MVSDLRGQTVKGVKWNSVGTITTTVLQMLKLFVLARILTKADFGLIAIATMFLGFTEIFANLGLATGLIHKTDISREQYSSVFWLNLLLSVVLYGVLLALSPLIARYYHQDLYLQIIPLLSLQLVINAFGKMFYTFKTKDLDFRFISIVEISGVSVSVVATVVMALNGFGVFSLVYGALLQSLLTHGVYAISGIRHYRILFHCRLSEIKDLLKIGGFQLSTQVLDYAAGKMDVFLIGRFFSEEVLGIYNLAKELLYKAVQLVNPIVTNVATPAFARFQEDMERMRSSYGEILHLLSFVNFPVFMAFFLFTEPVTLLLYGGEMLEMAWFVRVLSLWGLFQSIGNPAGILMVSLGRTDLGFVWTLVRIAIMLAGTYIACHIGIHAMAWTQVLLAFLFLFIYWRMMVYNMIRMPLRHYVGAVAFPLVAVLVAALPALPLLLSVPFDSQGTNLLLWLDVGVFGLAYLTFYWLARKGFIKGLIGMIR